ncbi:MAG: hypothetical protein HY341_00275 [Candidatus Kerfeldbacteria bacterium]|nr:hypothetical protein [Candidatus Kerfeldbacteria bacterium]
MAEISGLNPVLGHRVVTLVPQVHGGLLAAEDMFKELERLDWPWIDLVCVDFHPLEEEIAHVGATSASVIEKTDIGGPTMLRSGAKGRRIVIADPTDRDRVIAWLKAGEPDSEEFRNELAAKAEGIVARYCLASGRYHSGGRIDGVIGTQVAACKYGENPWQDNAALYDTGTDDPLALSRFGLVDGDAPSYINLSDVDRLLQTMTHVAAAIAANDLPVPAIAVGVKHGNPCGTAVSLGGRGALLGMLMGDPLAIFGGFVMTNFPFDQALAYTLRHVDGSSQKRLFDGVVAPWFTADAREELHRKGGKCRLWKNEALDRLSLASLDRADRFRYVRGGFLRQPNYTYVLGFDDPDLVISGVLMREQRINLLLAWAIGSTSNSNTITLVKDGMLVGNGVGQQDRVGAASLAIERARRSGHDLRGAVAYSDSFFPFPDGPQALIDAGVSVILATSGSVNDNATREVCRNAGVTLVLIPDKKARGFFGH